MLGVNVLAFHGERQMKIDAKLKAELLEYFEHENGPLFQMWENCSVGLYEETEYTFEKCLKDCRDFRIRHDLDEIADHPAFRMYRRVLTADSVKQSTDYTPEMREADARIMRAMGWSLWKWGPLSCYASWSKGEVEDGTFEQRAEAFEFHSDHEARASLLKWLTDDDARWEEFKDQLVREITGARTWPEGYTPLKALMIATPEQVAKAAHQIIIDGEEKRQ
jgi:hypothetical protein